MKIPFRKRYILGVTALVLLALAVFMPWTRWAEGRLTVLLEAQGFSHVQLHIRHIGLRGVALESLSFGEDPPLTLRQTELAFSLADILNGRLQSLALRGAELSITQGEKGWLISGLPASKGDSAFSLPVSEQDINNLPLSEASLEEGKLQLSSQMVALVAPFSLHFTKLPSPQLSLEADSLSGRVAALRFTIAKLESSITLQSQAQKWQGNWLISGIAFSESPVPVPFSSCKGKIAVDTQALEIGGDCSGSGDAALAFHFTLPLQKPEQWALNLTKAVLPWQGGKIVVSATSVRPGHAITLPVQLQRLPLDMLLKTITGGKASASGSVSGQIPVTIPTQGDMRVSGGSLKADGEGIIRLPPDVIPGEGSQIALVRELLTELHYSELSAQMDSDAQGQLGVTLTVSGFNPGVMQARPVHLHVRLGGDVLQLIRQGFLTLNDPKSLIIQGTHAP